MILSIKSQQPGIEGWASSSLYFNLIPCATIPCLLQETTNESHFSILISAFKHLKSQHFQSSVSIEIVRISMATIYVLLAIVTYNPV